MNNKTASGTPTALHSKPNRCWCGHTPLEDYSAEYLRCVKCETLILRQMPGKEIEQITNEDTDLYGRNYYVQHLVKDYGYPDLDARMRHDLPERCLHWLTTLLKYIKPGAKILELGCSHGASVALFRKAGYDASGLEISPWLVRYAANAWGVPILQGAIEKQTIPAGSLDAILMFDVLEHLQSPLETIKHCVSLLKPDGMLVVQTPRYPEGKSYSTLLETNSEFIAQFKPVEHLYLYSSTAARLLMSACGLSCLSFEPAIFAQYDQYFVATRSILRPVPTDEMNAALMASPDGRFVGALLDLNCRVALSRDFQNETNLLQAQLADLQKNFDGAEQDRLQRGKLIETQGQNLIKLEADFDARLNELKTLYISAETLKNERNLLQAQLADLQKNFAAVEADRLQRGNSIEVQGNKLSKIEAEFDVRLKELSGLYVSAETLKNERNLLQAQLTNLQQNFAAVEADRIQRGNFIEVQGGRLSKLEAEFDVRLKELNGLYVHAETLKNKRNLLQAQLADLQQNFAFVEQDRLARAKVIEDQGRRVAELEKRIWLMEQNREELKGMPPSGKA